VEVEQRMQDLDHKIRPLLKEKKKLTKIESELANVNFLIDSGIGSKAEQKALRQEKKKIRQRRVEARIKLEALPGLEEEHCELAHQLDVLRRRHGLL